MGDPIRFSDTPTVRPYRLAADLEGSEVSIDGK